MSADFDHFDTEVVIVGAGMAGLAAAKTLATEEIETIVLEAREKPGGRVLTHHQSIGGQKLPIELGAEFIHWQAESSRLWRALLKTHGLSENEIESAGQTILPGRLYHDRRDRPPKSTGILRELQSKATQHLAHGGSDMAVRLFVRRHPLATVTDRAHHELLRAVLSNEYGEGPEQLSLRSILEPNSHSKRNYRILEGFDALVRGLIRNVKNLRLGCAVKTIQWGSGKVLIETERGEWLSAKSCIVTVPIGVLQKGIPVFEPPLPEEKRIAIASLAPGRVTKVMMQFRKRFWKSRMAFLRGGKQQLSWAPLFHHDREAPFLMALVGGKDADVLADIGGGEAARTVALEIMRAYDVKHPKDQFVNGRIAAWHREHHIYTGYSSRRIGAPVNVRDVLRSRLANRIWFAGEATSTEHPATVTGALETGILAAQEIIDHLSAPVDETDTVPHTSDA